MATVSQNITTIIEQAEILDTLVTHFIAAKAIIDAAEAEIRKAQPQKGREAIAGRSPSVVAPRSTRGSAPKTTTAARSSGRRSARTSP